MELSFSGLPTGPQVAKIEERYPDMEALRGQIITHEELEKLTGEKRASHRYKTVIDAWRRKVERNSNVIISGRHDAVGVGFKVLTHGEQVDYGVQRRKSGGRAIRRGYLAVASTKVEKLSDEQRKVREHEMFAAAKINAAMLASRRQLGESPLNKAEGQESEAA